MQLSDKNLRDLQLEQLKILKVIDVICKQLNINYSLYEGTAIGAIRHRGFIPWDDDLDICMDRNDYLEFCKYCKKNLPHGYTLLNHHVNDKFTQSFSKIVNTETMYVTEDTMDYRIPNGIFVDVFPMDKVKNNFISKFNLFLNAIFLNLFLRKHSVNSNSYAEHHHIFIDFISKFILFIIPKSKYDDLAMMFEKRIIAQRKEIGDYVYVDVSCFDTLKRFFHLSLFDNLIEVMFEGELFPIFKDYDTYLKQRYGQYMKLPDEDERILKHRVIEVKFQKCDGETYE